MKKIFTFLAFALLVVTSSKAQMLYGNKFLEKTGAVFSFTNEPYHTSPWNFDCSCTNSCAHEWWKFYGEYSSSPSGLHKQNIVYAYGHIQLFQVDASQSVPNVYKWKHIGRKYVQSSFWCSSCECFVNPISGEDFDIIVCDFTWANSVSSLQYICKSTATPIDLKNYLNYYDNVVSITGPGIDAAGILNVASLTPGTYTASATRGFDNLPSKTVTFTFTVVDFNAMITSSPAVPVVCQGTPLQLTANPSGDSYKWYLNGVLIPTANTQTYNVTTGGNYSVEVTQNGCSKTSPIYTVTVNPAPTPTTNPSGNVFLCTGQNMTITSSPATSYVWSSGQTTASIIVNAAGSYSVTQTNSFGCMATSPAVNVIDAGNSPAAITSDIGTSICNGQTATLTVTTPGDSYKWYKNGVQISGATGITYSTTTPGDYYCVVTTGACNSNSNHIVLTLLPAPVPSISANPSGTPCEGTNVTLTSGAASSYNWSNGQTTQAITVNTAGAYQVTVQYANGCSNSNTYNLSYNPNLAPVLTPAGATTFCQGGSVQLVSTATSGTYTWYKNGLLIPGATTDTYTATSSGNYTVKTTQLNGCEATSGIVVVTVNPNPNVSISNLTGLSCNGSPVTLQANTTPSVSSPSYLWNYNSLTNQQITVSNSGTYTCQVTDGNGCSGTGSYNFISNSMQPPVITASGATSFCSGGVVTLSSSYSTGNAWYKDGQPLNQTSQSIVVSQAGSYYVTTSNGTCSASSTTVTVIIYPAPSSDITANGPLSWCDLTQPATTLTANLEQSYQWYLNNTVLPGATNRNYTPLQSGAYSVQTTNIYGCSSMSAAINITILNNPKPTVSIIGTTTFCQGDSTILTSSPGSAYLWTNGATSQSVIIRNSGLYNVTTTHANGCANTSDPVLINVLPGINASISAGGPTTFCQGDSVILTASPSGVGYSYLWVTGETTRDIKVTSSGNYWCSIFKNSCNATSNNITVQVNSRPSVSITGAGSPVCSGNYATLYGLSSSPNMSWIWNTGQTTDSIHAYQAGPYTVTGINANGCSSVSAPVTLTILSEPKPTISSGGSLSFCQGGSVVLTSSLSGTYQWFRDGNPLSLSTRSITATVAGFYTVKTTGAAGCSNTSDAVEVIVYSAAPPTIQVQGSLIFCQGDSVILTASAASGYLWSTGSNQQSITVKTAGTYSVTTTSGFGCSGTSNPVTVQVKPIIRPTITYPNGTNFCEGDSLLLVASSGLSYAWSNGAGSQSIFVVSAGAYTVSVQNANGCTGTSDTAYINMKPNPVPVITPSRSPYVCDTPSLSIISSLAVSYQWSTGATSQSIQVPVAGNYWVKVTNPSGCQAKSPVLTVQTGYKLIVSPIGNKKFCIEAGPQTFTYGNPAGGYYTGNGIGAGGTVFYPDSAGVGTHLINYNVISPTGCLSYTTFAVTVTAKKVWHTNPDTAICIASGNYDLYNNSMPISNTTYAGPGVTGRYFNPTAAGIGTHTIVITVNDSLGCIESKQQMITVFDRPTKPVITGASNGCLGDTVTLAASSSVSANSYRWYILGNPVPVATTQLCKIVLTGGNLKVYVIALSASGTSVGCLSESSDTLTLQPKNPTGDFYADFTSIPWGGLVKFTPVVTNTMFYNWKFGDSGYSAQVSPGHYYYREGKFTVTLKATSPEGCITTITKPLYITVGKKPTDTTAIILPIGPTDNKNPYRINLFPNPYYIKLWVTFALPAASEKITITAYNQYGEIIAEEKLKGAKGNNKIELKNFFQLRPQVYYVFKVSINSVDVYFKQIRIIK